MNFFKPTSSRYFGNLSNNISIFLKPRVSVVKILLSLLSGFSVAAQCPGATAPSSISGSSCVLYGGTTLGVVGGSLGQSGIYQWGTGTTPGQNIISSGQWANTLYVNPANATTYWLRIYNTQTQCATAAAFKTVTKLSSPPNYIEWIAPVCSGVPFTLKALGGESGTNSSFQWGTGAVGTNIITSQTGPIATFTATANTTYWVRRVDAAPCSSYTDARTFSVSVISSASTSPTSISSSTALPLCPDGGGTTLTALGGSSASGAVYQWGTGNVIGSNILPGQTAQTMWVGGTSTTTYWVRRLSPSPCGTPTGGVIIHVPVASYSTTPTSIASTAVCTGGRILTAVGGTLSTGAVYQWGTGYNVGANIIPGQNGVSITVNPASQTVYWVRTVDPAPCYQPWIQGPTIVVNVTAAVPLSTAPTAISGAAAICLGNSTTLTATGGISRPNSVFQWGTGAVGSNIITGTTASITVQPTVSTTYWVRRFDPGCGYYTPAVQKTVTVSSPTMPGSLSAAQTTVCSGTAPAQITLSGNGGAVIKWQRCNNSSFSGAVTDIASTSTVLTSNLMGPITTTTYYRAVIQGTCVNTYTSPIAMTIPAPITFAGGVWNGTVTAEKAVIINDDITLDSDLSVCSCKVAGSATLTISDGKTLTIQKALEVMPNANIIVEPNGSILQVDDAAVNTGTITYKRQTTAMRATDFTYWSSPVNGFTLFNLSANTRHDKYMSFNPIINNWSIHLNGAIQMEAGQGYIVRAPEGWSLTNATQGKYTATFNGVPNNGVIPVSLKKGAGTFNLIGNPYPSAIDIDLFLTDPANANLVNGTIYLWSHNTAISSTTPGAASFNYTADDYAKYNLTGGVKTASAAVTGGAAPTGKIAAGQGFFIEANSSLANGTYTATFNNSMRLANENNQFFRAAGASLPQNAIEKHRLWLNISNAGGAYDEMLVGYIEGATNELDAKYDGAIFPAGNAVSIYSILDENRLSIQGRALPFNVSDVIPVGYKSTISGAMTISIDNFDGDFTGNDVYLLDTATGTMHDLKAAAYDFTTAAGTFNSRFEIHFTGNALDVNPIISTSDVWVNSSGQQINIDAASHLIKMVEVYDLTGKLLFGNDSVDAADYTVQVNVAPQIVLVQVTLDSKSRIVKKVMIR